MGSFATALLFAVNEHQAQNVREMAKEIAFGIVLHLDANQQRISNNTP
jgi:hypothetical protein